MPPELRRRLERLPPVVADVARRLGPAFTPDVSLVGGAVRDLLMGIEPVDLDLVVEGPLGPVAERLGGEVRGHDRFTTATVTLGGHAVDIARARRETYAAPGALPDVTPASLEDDLPRRDFTVNAAALGLTGSRRGRLFAVPGALEDLVARRLRIMHPASFRDDPTRLLRLARYAARLGFEVEGGTAALAGAAIRGGALATVSGTRIGNELRLLSREGDPVAGWLALRTLALDEAIAPGLGVGDPAAVRRALAVLPADGRADRLVMGAALEGVQAARRAPLLDALGFTASDRDVILAAAERARALAAALAAQRGGVRPSEIAAAVGRLPVEAVALAAGHGAQEPAQTWLEHLRHVSIEIDGGDLLAAGVPAGPAVGAGLRAALAAALDGTAPERDEQLAVALRAAAETG